MKTLKLMLVLSVALLVSACKQQLDGVYSDQMEVTTYTFKPDGKMVISALGSQVFEATYEIEGNNIKIVVPSGQGDMVMTLMKDGSIQGPMGIVLTKKQSDRKAQPENSYAKAEGSLAEKAGMAASPLVRQGIVQTFRRDSNGRLINLGAEPSSSGSGQALPGDVEVKRIVLNNLRQLSAAADQFYLENGVSTANYDQLVGPTKYVREIRSADGEDYRTLVFKQGRELLVTTRTGLTIRYAP